MISASDAADAAIIEAFAGIPALLDQTPALIARGRLPDCECLLGPASLQAGRAGRVQGDLYFYRVDGDLRGRVERIDTKVCPLFLLTGEYDFSCTPEDTKRTAAAIGGGASVTIMEQLGHFPMSENPERFRRYMAPVLDRIVAT